MSKTISIEVNGQTITGTYTVEGATVTVSTINGIGIKSARVGSMGAEALAKILLRELVDDEKGP